MVCSLAVLAIASVRRIPEGQVYSLRRVGGQTRIVGAGTHFMLPLIERVSHKISLTGSALEVAGSFDSGETYNGSLYFQVLDPQRADRVIESVDSLLRQRAVDLLASAATPADPLERRLWLKQNLNAEVRERGLLVTRIDLRAAA
jgi:hypothetical protein